MKVHVRKYTSDAGGAIYSDRAEDGSKTARISPFYTAASISAPISRKSAASALRYARKHGSIITKTAWIAGN